MASLLFSLSFLILLWVPPAFCRRPTFRLDFHHRFSDTVRRWAESRPGRGLLPGGGWPKRGTADYYAALAAHDRGRLLADGPQELTFADGNQTLRLASLGFLHYALVELGTPNVTFLMALDTGSHLSWVPCDCRQCAPTSSSSYGFNIAFNTYSPDMSSSSRSVPCNSSFCENQSKCSAAMSHCHYLVAYASVGTSSSGILVEDVLYLTTEDNNPQVVKARIVFGCGMVQTGSFLETAAPNGLFGLDMGEMSVPSLLSSAGHTSDSFSMCFGRDGIGRISFGDKGSSDQDVTPFHINKLQPTYNVSILGISVDNSSTDVGFSALIDSGTSFTSLADPVYTHLSESFNAQSQNKRRTPDPTIPFEYCYHLSSNGTGIEVPHINFTMESGSQFPIIDPIIIISLQQQEYVYCLAVVKSHKINIIGQNFMTGLRIVFDRERLVLGWKKSNCYDVEDFKPLPVKPRNSSAPPLTIAVGPSSYAPKATRVPGNNTILTPPLSHSASLNSFTISTFICLLVPLAIL